MQIPGTPANNLHPISSSVANSLATATTGTAAAASTSTTSTSTSSSGTDNVTSGDFLTLLVTEMKNQDPTQPTDPNAYIQQLTEVNSLQQLIAINQDLSGATPATGSSTTTTGVTN